jgi:hypothetical protein
MSVGGVAMAGRLPRGRVSTSMNGGSTLHDVTGLAIRLGMQGFTPGGHRDSSLYRGDRVS